MSTNQKIKATARLLELLSDEAAEEILDGAMEASTPDFMAKPYENARRLRAWQNAARAKFGHEATAIALSLSL